MSKKFLTLALAGLVLSAATVCFAESVYATKNGKKYHKEDCPLIVNKGAEEIPMKQALEKGLTPCQKCFKEESSAVSPKAESKQTKGVKEKKEK